MIFNPRAFLGKFFRRSFPARFPDSSFSSAPQKYEVVYELILSNNSSHEKRVSVVFPVPPETTTQNFSSFRFLPEGERKKDLLFQNDLIFFERLMAPGDTAIFKEEFQAEVQPFSFVPTRKYLLVDYGESLSLKEATPYLQSNRYVAAPEEITRLAATLKGEEEDVLKILKKINDYVIERLEYGNPKKGLYSFHDALHKNKVDCGGFDTLFASLALALAIPVRVVSGFWAGYERNSMHAWVEVMLPDGTWLPADPSVQKLRSLKRTIKLGGLGSLGSDRLAFSYGEDIPLLTNGSTTYVDILQHPYVHCREGLSGLESQFSLKTKRLP